MSAGRVAPANTFYTPKGEVPWTWRAGCIEALAQGVPLGGLAAYGLARSTIETPKRKRGKR